MSWPKKSSANEATILSPFLSTRALAKLCGTRGPSFGFSVSQELARILNRDGPPEAALQAARLSIERAEDDLWPEDGENIPTENARWNQNQIGSDVWTASYSNQSLSFDTASKRQKISHSTFNITSAHDISVLNSERYSICNTTLSSGFVSAGAHLKVSEAKATVGCEPKRSQRRDGKEEKSSTASLKKLPPNQGSIHSFFLKPSSNKPNPSPVIDQSDPRLNPQLLPRQREPFPRQTVPLREVTNWKSDGVRAQPQASSSFSSTHKPRSATVVGRPQKGFDDDEQTTQRYVLFSSSPTKPDSEDYNHESVGDGEMNSNNGSLTTQMNMSEAQSLPNVGFTQATTFHIIRFLHQPLATVDPRRTGRSDIT